MIPAPILDTPDLPTAAADGLMAALRSGVATFLGLPLRLEPEPAPGAVLGAPFDGGVLNRPGARLGPWALRAASLGLGRQPMPLRLQGQDEPAPGLAAAGWVDGGNIPTLPFSAGAALEAVERTVGAWALTGARTLMLGGDHLMTLGALRAHARLRGPLGLLVLDAHPDAGDGAPWGVPCHHGTWLRQAIQEGLVDTLRSVVIGLRAPRWDGGELEFLAQAGVRLWTPWDIKDLHLASKLQGDIARVGQGPAYVSLDLDALDPDSCPAVAEPVPGGLTPFAALALLEVTRRWPVPWAGADVMELAPTLAGADRTARVGVHLALRLLA
jgi:arginase family enzyme